MVGQYVEVSGIVTAVGTQKDAYTAAYYYIQMATGSEYAGLEVFKESHTYTRGMMLTVKGVIRESYGVTELVECFSTVTGIQRRPSWSPPTSSRTAAMKTPRSSRACSSR